MKLCAHALTKLTEIPTELSDHAVETGSDILADLAKRYSERSDDLEDTSYLDTAKSVLYCCSVFLLSLKSLHVHHIPLNAPHRL